MPTTATRTAPASTPSTAHGIGPAAYLGSQLVGTWRSPSENITFTFNELGQGVLHFGPNTAQMQFDPTYNHYGTIDGRIKSVSISDPGLRKNGEVILGWRPHHWINLYFGPHGAQPTSFYKERSVLPYEGAWYNHGVTFNVATSGQATLNYQIYTTGKCPMPTKQRAQKCSVKLYLGRASFGSNGATFTIVGSYAQLNATKGRFGFLNGSQLVIAGPQRSGTLSLHLPVPYIDHQAFSVCDVGTPAMQPGACSISLRRGCERLDTDDLIHA
jgi:hypothetical protein